VTVEALLEQLQSLERESAKLREQSARLSHERDEYKKLYELVSAELERWRRHLFGRRAEQVDPSQMQLALAAVVEQIAAASASDGVPSGAPPEPPAGGSEETANAPPGGGEPSRGERGRAKETRPTPHGRSKLPENLPLERIELDPPAERLVCACCGTPKRRIGEEVSERLDWRPASLIRVQTVRGKYACKCEEDGVVIAEPAEAPIEKGLPGPGLLAHVVVTKYGDHQPLNRLEGIFERQGARISRSTMCGWTAPVAELLSPIVEAMAKDALNAHCINTDDTGLPVQAPGKARRGAMWVYLADEDHAIFRYTPTRAGKGPRDFLAGYKGYVQADAATLYDKLFALQDGPTEVGCWAHSRRRFFDAQVTDADRARIGLGFIRKLYDADDETKKLPPASRTARRHALAMPVVVAFKQWLDTEALRVLPKSPIGDAIAYARNHWQALTRFLEDGRLKLDNNASERHLRLVALGRNNWTFAGSDEGAARAAIFWTLLASCRMHRLDPFVYLRDVLVRVATHPARDVLALCPKRWAQAKQQRDAEQHSAPSRLAPI
jgi:transposase